MDGQRRRDVALAVLTVLAITLAAVAAVPMFSQGPGDEPGAASDTTVATPSDLEPQSEETVPEVLWAAIVGLVYAIWEIVAVVVLWLLSFFDPFDLESGEANESVPLAENQSREEIPTTTSNGTGGFGDEPGAPSTLPIDEPLVLLLFAVLLLLGVTIAVRYDAVGSVVRLVSGSDGSDRDPNLDGLGRVAGAAADRVEAANSPEAADNAIYRAWNEMVDLLGVPDPQSDTPRQFADAAVEAGMDPDDVSVLTRTFEEVRYGGASVSEERRREASDAFRRIEAEYTADDETVTSDDTDRDPEVRG